MKCPRCGGNDGGPRAFTYEGGHDMGCSDCGAQWNNRDYGAVEQYHEIMRDAIPSEVWATLGYQQAPDER